MYQGRCECILGGCEGITTLDLWISSNSKVLMVVVAHYTNRLYKVYTRLLALRRLYGRYGGENQAALLI